MRHDLASSEPVKYYEQTVPFTGCPSNCLQKRCVSTLPQYLSQTLTHIPSVQISTLPSILLDELASRTSPDMHLFGKFD